MLTLAESVADPLTRDTEFGVDTDEIGPAVDDLSTSDRHVQPSQPCWSPASKESSISNLGDGLERQDLETADEEGPRTAARAASWAGTGRCRRRCRPRPAGAPSARSAQDGGKEGVGLLCVEVVDHHLPVGRMWSGTTKELLNGELDALTADGLGGRIRHLTTQCKPGGPTRTRPLPRLVRRHSSPLTSTYSNTRCSGCRYLGDWMAQRSARSTVQVAASQFLLW